MDAIVTAGGIPQPGEHLYEYTQGKPKALVDICGKPMIQWVLDALGAARQVERIIIIGLDPNSEVTSPKETVYLSNQGSLLHNLRAGMAKAVELNPQVNHVVAVSSDVPAITGEMIDWIIANAQKSDLDAYYSVVARPVMEARYPASKRSYTRLKDIEVCGADVNVLRARISEENDAVWERIIAARKNVFKQAALIGYDTLLLVLLRLINLKQAEKMVTRRLGLTGQVVVCPYAEVGMDVDKSFQLEMVRADLARRIQELA